MTQTLTPVEEQLLRCALDGTVLDLLSPDSDPNTMPTWGPSRQIRAGVLRDLLLGRLSDAPLDPRGVHLRGAVIADRVNLTSCLITVPLKLTTCRLDLGLTACDARIPTLELSGSRLTGRDEPALHADSLIIDGNLLLDEGFTATTHSEMGAVRLLGARIGGQFGMPGATLTNDTGPALHADLLAVEGSMFLGQGFTATANSERGAVRLLGARVGGQLAMRGATLTNNTGPALHADHLAVGGSIFLDERFAATGESELGAVRLPRAHIGGQLLLSGATVTNDTGPALHADGLTIGQGLRLDNDCKVSGHGDGGAVRFLGARIGSYLAIARATLTNDTGPALHADSLTVDGNMLVDAGFAANGDSDLGVVRLARAHISGQLVIRGTTLTNTAGPALHADLLTVDRDMLLQGCIATGSSYAGAVRLSGAHIGGQLILIGATLTNDTGPALDADMLTVDRYMSLEGFTATGHGELGAVRLTGAHIGGQLILVGATLTNETGPALDANSLAVDGNMHLGEGLTATGHSEFGAIRLSGAHIGGQLTLSGATLTNDTGPALDADQLAVDGNMHLGGPFTATGEGEFGAVTLIRAHIGGQLRLSGATLINDTGPALYADGLTVSDGLMLDSACKATGHGELGAVRLLGAHIGGQLALMGATLANDTGPALSADSLTVGGSMFLGPGFTATGHGDRGRFNCPGSGSAAGSSRQVRYYWMLRRDRGGSWTASPTAKRHGWARPRSPGSCGKEPLDTPHRHTSSLPRPAALLATTLKPDVC